MVVPYRILLIDDDQSILKLLQFILEKEFGDRITLSAFCDPREGLEAIDNVLPDVVITDLDMPVVDGLEILALAKQRNAWTQVLLLTGHSSTSALLSAMEGGATDYLLKPVDHTKFLQLIEQSLERIDRWRTAMHGTVSASR